jgi:hypothetical protein
MTNDLYTNSWLAREVAYRGNFTISDVMLILRLIPEVVMDALLENRSVKVLGLFALSPVIRPEHTEYDGINKKRYLVPETYSIQLKISVQFVKKYKRQMFGMDYASKKILLSEGPKTDT